MDVNNRPTYVRPAVLFLVFLLHGGLVLIFLREKPADRNRAASAEVYTTLIFIDDQPHPPPETARIAHRPLTAPRRHSSPDASISLPDTTVPAESPAPAAPPAVDWSAEAHRSAAEIARRAEPGGAAQSQSSPAGPAPWDPNSRLLESTGHGLRLRIPVEIPGDIIDHCFANMDLGHNQGGKWELYQLMCALRKQPARGDLFDSLRKPSQAPK